MVISPNGTIHELIFKKPLIPSLISTETEHNSNEIPRKKEAKKPHNVLHKHQIEYPPLLQKKHLIGFLSYRRC